MTNAQKIFCDEYLIDLNATRAYKVAYPKVKKDETANVNGSRLLRNAKVQSYIEEKMKKREKRTQVTQDKVVKELAAIAFSNATDFAEIKKGCVYIKDTSELDESAKKSIIGIKEGKEGIEVKMANKVDALTTLGRHLGMFKDKLEVLVTGEKVKEVESYIEQRVDGNE